MLETAAPAAAAEFAVEPFTERCRVIRDRGEHALIGVSPGNSYFSRDRLAALLTWAGRNFAAVDVVYADVQQDAVLRALGYRPDEARRKAKKELDGLRRRIRHALGEVRATARIRVSALSEFRDSAAYRELRGTAAVAVRQDPVLRAACERMVEHFYTGKIPAGAAITAEQQRAGLEYLVAELPFFADTPRILGTGSSVSCYHAPMPVTPALFARRSGLRPAAGQGVLVVRPVDEVPRRVAAGTAAERNLRT